MSYRRTETAKFLENFDPEKSTREKRKLTRKIYSEGKNPEKGHDSRGHSAAGDVCDCLNKTCPGCHFPCARCSSSRCGSECRVNRKWSYDSVKVEGTN